MGIGAIIVKGWKVVKALPKYLVSSGTVSKARKAVKVDPKASIFTKQKVKAKAGWDALIKDLKGETKQTKFGVGHKLKKFFTSFKRAWSTGIHMADHAAFKATGKVGAKAGFMARAGKVLKCYGGIFKRIPVTGTLLTFGWEGWNVIKAFTDENGGTEEGLKQIGRSTVKLAGSAALGALGSVFGPVGFVAGLTLGDYLAGKALDAVFGKSLIQLKEEEEERKAAEEAARQAQQDSQAAQPDDTAPADNTRVEQPAVEYRVPAAPSEGTDSTADNGNPDTTESQVADSGSGDGNTGSAATSQTTAGFNPFAGFNGILAFGGPGSMNFGMNTPFMPNNPYMAGMNFGTMPSIFSNPMMNMGNFAFNTGANLGLNQSLFNLYPQTGTLT